MNELRSPRLDPALFSAARDGDPQALGRLIASAQPDVRRYARRSCNNSADAEDAVQETLWLLYRRAGSLRALTALSGWLLTVVRRQCLRLARPAMRRQADMAYAADSLDFIYRPQDELSIDLTRAIQSLPAHYREIILLRDIQEMTIDEIGTALGLTRESVKARLHRSRILLREYLRRDQTAAADRGSVHCRSAPGNFMLAHRYRQVDHVHVIYDRSATAAFCTP